MKKIFILLFLLCVSLFAQKKVITVTIDPQKFIVEKIVKTNMKVKSVYSGSDFHIRFRKLALKEISYSDLYITIGLDLEKNILTQLKAYNKDLAIFNMSKDVRKMPMNGKENPYVWTDPLKVRDMAKTVFLKISDLDPKNREFYRKNYEDFAQELDDLYLKIKLHFSNSSFGIYTFDSYWDYYLTRFDFRLYKINKEVLSADEISKFIRQSKERKIEVLLVDELTPLRIAKSIASNATSKIVTSDIFKYSFMGDLFLLSQNITKK